MTYIPSLFSQAPEAGTVTIADGASSGTATLSTAINTTYHAVVMTGCKNVGAGGAGDAQATIVITDSTTITAARYGTVGAMTVGFITLPFHPTFQLQAVQPISITVVSGSATATVTAVGAKAVVFWCGFTSTSTTEANYSKVPPLLVKTNTTTYTASVGSDAATDLSVIVKVIVVDFK